ncbi:MAG TPA: hypothetical protein VGQ71_01285 [Terriglobales bacterium]|jgi:hypothetical protein|nr:hypothetical protein [Terriglobales bacterium]
MTSHLPTEVLEARAADQRRRLHNSVVELRSRLRETLDLRKAARQHLRPAAGMAALVGLFLGYAFTGMFTRR